jgi:hypothetical protein
MSAQAQGTSAQAQEAGAQAHVMSAKALGAPTTTQELSPCVQAKTDAQELLPKFPSTGIEPVANRCLLQG